MKQNARKLSSLKYQKLQLHTEKFAIYGSFHLYPYQDCLQRS